MKKETVKPKSKKEWALHRCKLNCEIAINALNDEYKNGDWTANEYALYCIVQAISEFAVAMGENNQNNR